MHSSAVHSSAVPSPAAKPVLCATADEWAAQAPTLLVSVRNDAAHDTGVPSAMPLKRRSSSGGSSATKRQQRQQDDAAGADSNAVLVGTAMLGDSAAASRRRCAPSFAAIPNSVSQYHLSKAAAAAVAAASSPAAIPASSPLPLRLTKKQSKLLSHDFAQYKSSLASQATLAVESLLPKRALAMARLEQRFERERAAAETDYAKRTAGHAATVSAEEQGALLRKSTTVIHTLAVPTPAGAVSPVVPLVGLHTHAPKLRPALPALGSECVQHGWTFRQPSRAHPLDGFVARWVGVLQSELADLVSVSGLLRCSLTLSMPEASDADNARLEIAEELMGELRSKEDWAVASKGRFVSYSMQRAKLLTKVIKYPGIPDYLHAVDELDNYTRVLMQVSLASLRNSYVLLYELYQKNADKLLVDPSGDQAFQSMIA